MMNANSAALLDFFGSIRDPRVDRTKHHLLQDIITIAILAVISGADNWSEVAAYGRCKRDWLAQFLALVHGIPSHDTFGRVFARIDPKEFGQCFQAWITAVSVVTAGQVIALDGKTLRRSYDRVLGKSAIQMVSAWATRNHIVLGQIKVDGKSNEITALPQLLALLEVKGCIVTIDAIGCQKGIAQAVVDKEADYVLAVKDNQPHLAAEIVDLFACAEESQFRDVEHDYYQTTNKGHGRIEIRRCWTISDPDYLRYLRSLTAWPQLHSIVKIVAERRIADTVTSETRYYISSLQGRAKDTLTAVRHHWGIENNLHWVLDIAFREDESRIRKDNGPENFSLLRRIALNLLQQEKTAKIGVKGKRLLCGWDEKYLLSVLLG
jgi:predicted transposase YbfD/YdcC